MRVSLVQNFLTGIADAGRELWDRRRSDSDAGISGIRELCLDLLSQKGEALGTALARELMHAYDALDDAGRHQFFIMLRDVFSADLNALDIAIEAYRAAPGPDTVIALDRAVEAPRKRLVRAINMAPGGTAAVIAMRRDLLALMREDPSLEIVDVDFMLPLASWFNRGFLQLERIDWQTPAHVLEKLIQYESVHAIQGWEDLRRRLGSDRRCFAFFHPALPDEPLIFVEVALVSGLAHAIQPLLERDSPHGVAEKADTAIFYSINNCQTGLRGISFGNFLIKQVVAEIEAELPNIKTFATLSPIPGFGRWLQRIRQTQTPEQYGLSEEQFATLPLLDQPDWFTDEARQQALQKPLLSLCAYYLLREQNKDGKPRDPVARFHLGNGAMLERINWLGDVSAKGIQQSAGLLVNYRYDLKKIVEYHEAFQNEGRIICAKAVQRLLMVKS
jgi:malonyl-CoA decarboxylase